MNESRKSLEENAFRKTVIKDNDTKMCSMDIAQRIIGFISDVTDWPMTTVQYPVKCGICKAKTKGNIIIGYRMGCKKEGH